MKTNIESGQPNLPTDTLKSEEVKNVAELKNHGDYTRFVHDKISTIESSYKEYIHDTEIAQARGGFGVNSTIQLDSIRTGMADTLEAFSRYNAQKPDSTPLRLDMDQIYTIANTIDDMSAEGSLALEPLGQKLDDEFGKIIEMSIDAKDPHDRDYLFANAYLLHRENGTPITEEYTQLLGEAQAFTPDGEAILYRAGLEDYNKESVDEIIENRGFNKAVMKFAKGHGLIKYNKKLHKEWNSQKAKSIK